jgi:hypothetical protein
MTQTMMVFWKFRSESPLVTIGTVPHLMVELRLDADAACVTAIMVA